MKILVFGKGGMSEGIKEALTDHEVVELTKRECDVRRSWDVQISLAKHKPDWIINCAGISGVPENAKWSPTQQAREEIETNLIGSANVALLSGGVPTILIASVAGLYGKPDHLGYCASKSGVISLAQSLGFSQPIWCISPGRVDTPMREKDYPGDTPGSRLDPKCIGYLVEDIMKGFFAWGDNIILRKVGLTDVIQEVHRGDGWKQKLRVGMPVTI